MKGLVDYQTRTVARKSSIGGFAFVRGDFTFEQGGLTLKFDKIPLICSVSNFNLEGLGGLFGG